MVILILISVFETLLFPRNIFSENEFNPALENRTHWQIIMGTSTKFQLSELRTYYLYSSIGSYRLSAQSFGNELYRENMLKLSNCFSVNKSWSVGIGMELLNNWVDDNFNRFTYSLSLSSAFRARKIRVSGFINNFNIPRLSDIDKLPISYSLRFDYQANNRFDVAFALRGLDRDIPFYNFCVIFSPYKIIDMGSGVNTDPLALEYTMGITIGDFTVVYFGSNHQHLGLSHEFNLKFCP